VLPSILDYHRMRGSLPPVLVFSLAALILFYKGVGTSDRELRGSRNDQSYPIRDDMDVLSFFEKRWHAFSKNRDLRALVAVVLANDALWGTDLTVLPGMLDAVAAHLQAMLVDGTRAAAASLIETASQA
jgi:tagaturonate reductase